VRLTIQLKIYDLIWKAFSKLSYQFKPRDLNERVTSYPYLCSDTYWANSQYSILDEKDLNQFLKSYDPKVEYKSVYIVGEMVQMLLNAKSLMPKVRTLIIMESDTTQYESELSSLYPFVGKIHSNNLIGSSSRCSPLPLGLERQAYRSAGRLNNFKYQSLIKNKKRSIQFLIAWNDKTNPNRKFYRAQFKADSRCFIVENRLHARTIHKLVRKSKFIPCPAGNGLDTHRVWEAIYLGAVPVILESEFCGDSTWPVLIVENWSELLDQGKEELNLLYAKHSLNEQQSIDFGTKVLSNIFGDTDE
jgi:hypothetical protein